MTTKLPSLAEIPVSKWCNTEMKVISAMLSGSQRFSLKFFFAFNNEPHKSTKTKKNQDTRRQCEQAWQTWSAQLLALGSLRENLETNSMARNKIPPKLAGYARAPEFQNTRQRHFVIRTITLLLQKRSTTELKFFPKSYIHFLPLLYAVFCIVGSVTL